MHFCIIIPTLNGADFIKYPIRSVLNQKHDDFTIIVSDNCSDSDQRVKDVIESFKDNRIKLTKTPNRLSMSGNWNHALQFIDGGYVTYLGDDDVLLPNAFNIVRKIVLDEHVMAITQRGGYYYFPDTAFKGSGWINLPKVDGKYRRKNSLEELRKVGEIKGWYGNLPMIYHGFISVNLINEALIKADRVFFGKAAPDMYSAVLLASQNISYVALNYPLTLGGSSKKSNGLSFLTRKSDGIMNQFISSSSREFKHNYSVKLISSHLLDCIEDVNRFADFRVKINYFRAFYSCEYEARVKGLLDDSDILQTLIKIRANIEAGHFIRNTFHWFCFPFYKYAYRYYQVAVNKIVRIFSKIIPINAMALSEDLRKRGICDVWGAAIYLHERILKIRISKVN